MAAVVHLKRQAVVVELRSACLGVEAIVCALDFVAGGGGFVTVSVRTEKTYGIHNWHDRVSFCLPCVILTLRLYGSSL